MELVIDTYSCTCISVYMYLTSLEHVHVVRPPYNAREQTTGTLSVWLVAREEGGGGGVPTGASHCVMCSTLQHGVCDGGGEGECVPLDS